MIYFSVKNFAEFQHYKDRSPPWIKLYNALLDDYEFCRLQDASKAHLILIWLLASRSENKLPFDPEWISRRISATEPVDLVGLAQAGFIITDQPLPSVEQVASNPLQEPEQPARPERETEERREETEERESGACAPPPKPKAVDVRDWDFDEKARDICLAEQLDPAEIQASVRDWAANAPMSDRKKRDPHAFLRKWCRREAQRWKLPKFMDRNAKPDLADREYLGATSIPMAQARMHAQMLAEGKRLPPSVSEAEVRELVAHGLVGADLAKERGFAA